MNSFENLQPQTEAKKRQLTREDVQARLERNENLENFDLKDLDLAGLELEGKSFRGSDIRGLKLFREDETEVTTNINKTNWTDCVVADLDREVYFPVVEAANATFGFSETLASRRKRWSERPPAEDSGGYFNFNGSSGNFKGSKWLNINFGGGTGYEALFSGAILSECLFENSDLKYLDFSESILTGIKIKLTDLTFMYGLKINSSQVEDMVKALELTDEQKQKEFAAEVAKLGAQDALKKHFGLEII